MNGRIERKTRCQKLMFPLYIVVEFKLISQIAKC